MLCTPKLLANDRCCHVPWQVLLAADAVYDNDITEAFMRAAAALLQPRAGCGDSGCAICSASGAASGAAQLPAAQPSASGGVAGCNSGGRCGGKSGGSGSSRKRMYMAVEKRCEWDD